MGFVCDAMPRNGRDITVFRKRCNRKRNGYFYRHGCGIELGLVDTLKNGDELPDMTLLKTFPEDVDLMTVKIQKSEMIKRETSSHYKQFINKKLKYKTVQEKLSKFKSGNPANEFTQDVPSDYKIGHDVILEISIHTATCMGASVNTQPKLGLDQKFQVLGSQRLTELRDKISCVNDLTISGDFSENPDDTSGFYAKDVYRSGFFYMEGVFYNDLREVDSRDYSSEIRKWAAEQGRGIGPMTVQGMDDVFFLDLKVRLGQPYLYLHQGNCEHIIIFTDIRLFHNDDIQDRREYPRLTYKRTYKRSICRVCEIHSSRWLTYGSEHAPDDPSFFCDQCFRALHYDKDGKKLGDFKAYKYFDKQAVV
ncbi:snRNA-activating protein complex subunit 3-like isoform X2 [Mizuhopecten yessoensis]|uniref:snRNA-activating protein complex subunit 3-like isoform X2 n=1 Tax=Mizuhopecten yessoensis TaxID=6573 RepID=UPI000B45CC2D|nr:snRNA-activating protein complex subunit 3-like isoform X2 [Mizuhopecten yessoensis]